MNNNLKINIFFDFQDGPWGGGNQFFKALRKELEKMGVYETDPNKADCILFYSYQKLNDLVRLRRLYPEKIFLHRIGTALHLHRGRSWYNIDRLIVKINKSTVDATIFISEWLHQEFLKIGFKNKKYYIVYNAPDQEIFTPAIGSKNNSGKLDGKIKLIAASWSENKNKGFAYYKFLEDHLDFNKYSMTFVGNMPTNIRFKKINYIGPMTPERVAQEFKKNDIYVTATQSDAYSNSIIEALSCGIPVVAIDSGGNREALANNGGGILFEGTDDFIEKIDLMAKELGEYKKKINILSITEIAKQYIEIAEEIKSKPRIIKKGTGADYYFKYYNFRFGLGQKIYSIIDKVKTAKRTAHKFYKYSYNRNLLEKFIEKYRHEITGEILDIGSKNRRYDSFFKGRVTSVDIVPNEECRVIYGDVERLDYKDNSFDSVVCFGVINYVERLDRALGEITRVLKPGGVANISTPAFQHDNDDTMHFTKKFIISELNKLQLKSFSVYEFGNGYTAMWDILKKKLILNGSYFKKRLLYFIFLLPLLIIIKLFKIEHIQDKYYSDLFITLKK